MTRPLSGVLYVALAGLLATGVVRATGADPGAQAHAIATMSAAAAAAGLSLQADGQDPTPVVKLAALVGVKPGSSAPIAATGTFPPGSRFSIRNKAFTLSNEAVTATSYKATVNAAPGAFPSVGRLEVVAPRGGRRHVVDAVYVAGSRRLDATLDNGWKLLLQTEPLGEGSSGSLRVVVDVFRNGEAKPFATLDGSTDAANIDPLAPSLSMSLSERQDMGGGPECTAIMKRMEQIGKQMGTGGATEKVMAEYEKVMEKYSECTEKMVAAQTAMVQRMQQPGWAKEQEARKAEFGCHYMRLTASPDGAAAGSVMCGAKVGEQKFKGALTNVGP